MFGDFYFDFQNQAMESEAVMAQFHGVYDKMNQALDDFPFDELGISVEVKEQVCFFLVRSDHLQFSVLDPNKERN